MMKGKFQGNRKFLLKNVNMVSTGWGNPSQGIPHTNHAGRHTRPKTNAWGGITAALHGDPRVPMIWCSIFDTQYDRALCDLGASINIMPKVIFKQLQYPALSPTMMCIRLADSSIRYPEGESRTCSYGSRTPSSSPTLLSSTCRVTQAYSLS